MIVVVFSYYASVTRTFWDVNRIYRELEACVTEAAEFTHLMLDPPDVEDKEAAESLSVMAGRIEFHDVCFGYGRQADSPLFFENMNLDIPSNQKVGLVGPSG